MIKNCTARIALSVGLAGSLFLAALATEARAQGGTAAPAATPAPAATAAPTATPAAGSPQPAPGGTAATAPKAPALPAGVLEEGQRLYQFGQDAYSKGRYDVAFGSFNRVYQLTKSPDLLYNLAKVALKLDQKEVAIGYYRQYLSSHPPDEAEVQKEMDALTGGPAPAPAPVAAPSAPSDSETKVPRWVPWAMIGGGAGLLGISLGLLVAGGISPAETAADQTQRRAMLAAGGVLGGIGLAATVGGVVLKVRDKSAKPATAARTLMALAPWGAGLQLVGTY